MFKKYACEIQFIEVLTINCFSCLKNPLYETAVSKIE